MSKLSYIVGPASGVRSKSIIPCGECSLTLDVITDTFETELAGVPVALDVREWLSEWWKPLLKGGWHAPIVMVEGRVVSQGHALNRGVLTEAIIDAHATRSSVEGNHLFGKATCAHCVRAKGYLKQASICGSRNWRKINELYTQGISRDLLTALDNLPHNLKVAG